MSDQPTNYQYQQTQQEAQQHYGQVQAQYALQQNNGHLVMAGSSNSGVAQLTATPSSQVQRFSSGISQHLHPNSPHGQLLQQLGQSAASPQQQIRHPSPPGPMTFQQQSDGARRETPPGMHPQGGYQSMQHLYQHQQQQQTAPSAQHRFAQPMQGIMGPPQQPQQHVSMLQTPQMQYRAQQQQPHLYAGAGQQPHQPRYAYIQRPEFHNGNPGYNTPGQQGPTYGEGGGGRLVMRHPQPVLVQQHPGYTTASHAQYTIPQPGRVYVAAGPGGIYHPTAVPTHSDSPSSVGNVYYAQQHPEQAPVAVTTAGYTNAAAIAVIDQRGGSSGYFVMTGQPQGTLKGPPSVQTEDKQKTTPLKSKPPSKGRGKAAASKATPELASSDADQASSTDTKSLLTHAELAHLARGIDATVTLDEDTADTVLSIVDDFVESLIKSSTEMSKQRGAKKLEAKDARFILERRYNLTIPSNSCAASTSATTTQAANATN